MLNEEEITDALNRLKKSIEYGGDITEAITDITIILNYLIENKNDR